MRTMAVVPLVIFCVLTGPVVAMPPADYADGVPDNGWLQQTFNLTDEQAETVKTILRERFENRLLLHKRHHDELEKHRTQTKERLSVVLDESQIEQFEAFRLWRERTGHKGGRR